MQWTVGTQDNVWPLYQASEADPEAGYTAQPHTIHFDLASLDAPAYVLLIGGPLAFRYHLTSGADLTRENVAWMTALGNNLSHEDMFLEQLKNHLDPDDVVIGISGSGGSTNVLRVLQYARTHGATTVLMTNTQPQAEPARPFVTLLLQAPSSDIVTIEAVDVALHHALT